MKRGPKLKQIFLRGNPLKGLKISTTTRKKRLRRSRFMRKIRSLPNNNWTRGSKSLLTQKTKDLGKKGVDKGMEQGMSPLAGGDLKTPQSMVKKTMNDLDSKLVRAVSQISPSSSKKRDLQNLEMIKSNLKKQLRAENIKMIDAKIEDIAEEENTNRLFDNDHMRT